MFSHFACELVSAGDEYLCPLALYRKSSPFILNFLNFLNLPPPLPRSRSVLPSSSHAVVAVPFPAEEASPLSLTSQKFHSDSLSSFVMDDPNPCPQTTCTGAPVPVHLRLGRRLSCSSEMSSCKGAQCSSLVFVVVFSSSASSRVARVSFESRESPAYSSSFESSSSSSSSSSQRTFPAKMVKNEDLKVAAENAAVPPKWKWRENHHSATE